MSDQSTGAQSTGAQPTEAQAAHDPGAIVPEGTEVNRAVGARHGMFGASGTGDTSGYGGLVRPIVYPAASQRPYGHGFDEVVDALAARLREHGVEEALG